MDEDIIRYFEILMIITKLCFSSSDKNKLIKELEKNAYLMVNDTEKDKDELHNILNEIKLKYGGKSE